MRNKYIVFLRAIDVGGTTIIKMTDPNLMRIQVEKYK